MKDYHYYTLDEELELYKKNIAAIAAVREKFPDATKMTFNGSPYKDPIHGEFCSESMVNGQVELDFWGEKWYTLSVVPHVKIPYEYGEVKIYHPFKVHKIFTNQFGIEIAENPSVEWNGVEEKFLAAGFKEEILKCVYTKILSTMSAKGSVNSNGATVRLVRDNIPDYILKMLPFT